MDVKFLEGTRNNRLDFGGDLNPNPDAGIFFHFVQTGFSLIYHNWTLGSGITLCPHWIKEIYEAFWSALHSLRLISSSINAAH